MIKQKSDSGFPDPYKLITSAKIEWPETDIISPGRDRNRLFFPEIVFESPYIFDVIRKRLSPDSANESYEGYYPSLSNANRFPYANGKRADRYFYLGVTGATKMIDLSEIIEFNKGTNDKIFWLVSTANKEFSSRGCNLYSNNLTRDLSLAEDFARQLERITNTIQVTENFTRQLEQMTDAIRLQEIKP